MLPWFHAPLAQMDRAAKPVIGSCKAKVPLARTTKDVAIQLTTLYITEVCDHTPAMFGPATCDVGVQQCPLGAIGSSKAHWWMPQMAVIALIECPPIKEWLQSKRA